MRCVCVCLYLSFPNKKLPRNSLIFFSLFSSFDHTSRCRVTKRTTTTTNGPLYVRRNARARFRSYWQIWLSTEILYRSSGWRNLHPENKRNWLITKVKLFLAIVTTVTSHPTINIIVCDGDSPFAIFTIEAAVTQFCVMLTGQHTTS